MRAEYIELNSEVTQHQEQNWKWTDSVVEAHWATKKVKEQLTLKITVNNEQEDVMKRLVSAHKTIKTRHETLVSQFWNLAASTAALRSRLLRIREQLQCDPPVHA